MPAALDDRDLKDAEQNADDYNDSAGSSRAETDRIKEGSLYKPEPSKKSLFSGKGKKKYALLAAGGGAGLIIIIVIGVAMFFLASLKQIHFETVLRSTGFAAFQLALKKHTSKVILSAATLSDDSTGRLNRYQDRTLVDKLRGVNPEKQLAKLGTEGKLKFEFQTESKWGGIKRTNNFKSVEIDGQKVSLDEISQKIAGKNYNDLRRTPTDIRLKMTIHNEFTTRVQTGMAEYLGQEGRSFRSGVYKGLRDQTGIRMTKWANQGREYIGLSAEEAKKKNAQDTVRYVRDGPGGVRSGLSATNDDVQKYRAEVDKAIEEGRNPSSVQPNSQLAARMKTVGQVSDVAFVTTIACIVNDLDNSFEGAKLEREKQVARLGHDAMTAADQTKSGDVTAGALGAENARWDGAESSVLYKESQGKRINGVEDLQQLDSIPSVPTPASKFASIIDVIASPIDLVKNSPPFLAAAAIPGVSRDDAFNKACDAVLHPGTQYSIAGAEIAATVVTFGGWKGITQTVKQSLNLALKAGGFITIGALIGQMADDTIKSFAGTDYSGMQSGPDLYNQSAVATNYLSQTGNRRINYGRPLTPSEAQEVQIVAMQQLRESYKNGSFHDRYFAADNPFSLIGRMAASTPTSSTQTMAFVSKHTTYSISQLMRMPFKVMSVAVSAFSGSVNAAPTYQALSENNFKDVDQWGFTVQELQRIDSDPSFDLENIIDYYNAHLNDTDTDGTRLYDKYEACYTFIMQADRPDDCTGNFLASDVALHWRVHQAYVYQADKLGRDELLEDDENVATGPTQSSDDPGDIKESSENIPCAQGTNDLGIHEGWTKSGGQPTLVKVRLCAVPNLRSSSSESVPGSKYYIQGANGNAIVNSRVSKNFLDLVTEGKAAGIALNARSSFRTMQHQKDLCQANAGCRSGNYRIVAQPGTSNHQLGVAIDFIMTNVSNGSAQTCAARVRAPNDPVWRWLYENGDRFGITQYSAESWHWQVSKASNSCGKD